MAGRTDSCGWYAAHPRSADGGRLPDKAAAVPVGTGAREEGCPLAVGPEATGRIFPTPTEDERAHLDLDDILRISPWWDRSRSYFGDDATALVYRSVLGARLDGLFAAYATDTAQRRGCTGVVLPAPE
ncbi:hypothetical protein [Streptomyces sp. NPDC092307]|uniref:hypothetical protein n=1 Tax=Streptomyces sp. NPDC092307 TaxID=3366013 RepID=UPI0037FE419C